MKNRIKISAIASLMLYCAFGYSQNNKVDSLGLPGDNLDLNAVLNIFKESSSVEDFEKKLNSADLKVNNLDLNNDQKVDYLRVVDYGKDDFHSLVIQDPVSKTESQDVAVIEVQKTGDNTAHIQIVGDEALYGKNYIIEPTNGQPSQVKSSGNNDNKGYADDVYDNGNNSNNNNAAQNSNSQIMVNVWGWPGVSYLYGPGYSYWASPWYWGYYPGWWSPWVPYYGWYAYHRPFWGWNYGYYCYRTNIYAFPHYHNYYYGHQRMASGYVQKTMTYGRRDAGNRISNGGAHRDGGQRASNGGGTRWGGGNNRNNNVDRNSGGGTRWGNSGQQRSNNASSGNISRGQTSGGGSPRFGNSGGGRPAGGGGGGRIFNGGGGGGPRGGGGGGSFGGGGGSHGGGGGGFGGGHGGGGRR